MKAYGKLWNYNVYDCAYCLYWHGESTGCTYPSGCCCPVPQHPRKRNGREIIYSSYPASTDDCVGCPYGRDAPCIGWCTKELLKTIRHGDDI